MVEEGDGTNPINDKGVEVKDGSGSENISEISSNFDMGYSDEVVYQTQEAEEWHNVLSKKNIRKNKSKASNLPVTKQQTMRQTNRRDLWKDLSVLGSSNLPWLVVGDFNLVLRGEDKRGGRGVRWNASAEFQEFVNSSYLLEANSSGSEFTWCNGKMGNKRILCKLDRMLCNQAWSNLFSGWKYKVLAKSNSDHSPLFGWNLGIVKPTNIPFRFYNMWTSHDSFLQLPNHDEIKINTDGAARGNPGKGGIGCNFRDSEGKVLGSLVQGLGLVINYTAECKAIIKGVELAASNGWLIAWVESDSKSAVKALNSDNISWTLEDEWANTKLTM
ncbi:hypothetical protein GIB67_014912 [Kingdonia uniflora]|uniref:RNase H type-1 domain-containing protein n=1 Tax=Kingdonia uniflora TaxID=39325 RepID=A0A7J7MTU9_9MAGN|nr:hypothetical protein GIB67_014912 [Kingdonia uniflora]